MNAVITKEWCDDVMESKKLEGVSLKTIAEWVSVDKKAIDGLSHTKTEHSIHIISEGKFVQLSRMINGTPEEIQSIVKMLTGEMLQAS
ncbi:hypothetical protein COB57_05475 [Candidatus Peregrinibacteria bacterium]|nr:MAG: hypothetical protein COB57_05475 [Candidatus Peregrinibacteria bacterium]